MSGRSDNTHWQRLGELFDQAIDLDEAGQADLVRTIEREDAGLAQALASLLAADARHQSRTAEHRGNVLQGTFEAIDGPDIAVGDRVGPYLLKESLGQGGMGVVYRAERADGQVRQEVALKVIKLGMDTRGVIARFEAERQALAMMDHPNIARMFDAGSTPTGRPYFVMELVHGEPITSYCASHDLSIVQRLQLFDQVCAAVQHAHTKGIIHRDLKPSNVLVSTQDGKPCAKVIDFGIAKATGERLTDKTLFTEQFQMIGTALYMSPEQAAGSADIDTRTDIYALGVILYELLTDTTPIESISLKTAPHAEVQRIIREVDPPRPSVRLLKAITSRPDATGAGSTAPGDTARRGMEPNTLVKMVRGELDWIVMKALEKDRTRRYETADALAQDVRRYLAGEAVLAAPPSTSYRMRKFVRRNKVPVVAGSLVAAALLAGIVAFAWQARIAREQARLARQHAAEVEQVAAFQADMLSRINPNQAGQQLMADEQAKLANALEKANVPEKERTERLATFAALLKQVNATEAAQDLIDNTLLKPAVAAIDRKFANQPVVAATLQQVLAERYMTMGLYADATPLQLRALATRRRMLGDRNPDTLLSIDTTGELMAFLERPDQAEPYYREALEKSRRALGPDHYLTQRATGDLGNLYMDLHRGKEAEQFLREALRSWQRTGHAHSTSTLTETYDSNEKDGLAWMSNLGVLLWSEDRFGEAEPYLREALARRRRLLGDDDLDTLVSINSLAVLLDSEGRMEEAERYYREAVERSRRGLGEDHPDTLTAIRNFGSFLEHQGKLAEAEPIEREGLEVTRRVLGPESPKTLIAASNMGALLGHEGKYTDAERLLAPYEAATRKVFTVSDPPRVALFLLRLGKARAGQGEFAASEANLLEAEPGLVAKFGPGGKYTIECMRALADLYTTWDAKEPGKGHAARAADWKKKLDAAAGAAAQPGAPQPTPAAHH